MGFFEDLVGGMKLHKAPIIGTFFDDPNEIAKQQALIQASQMYADYRPEAAQARLNGLRMQLSARDGARNWMNRMAPGVYRAPIVENPMSPRMQTMGRPYGNMEGNGVGNIVGQGLGGAGTGALAGTSVSPGYGTAVGAAVGGAMGIMNGLANREHLETGMSGYGPYMQYNPTNRRA